MFRFVKVIAVVLAVVALVASVAVTSVYHNSHEVACATDCSCDCCCISVIGCHAKANVAIVLIAQRAVISEPNVFGILLVADIFRPPTFI
jgi:predicted nicotinamide N-methyase